MAYTTDDLLNSVRVRGALPTTSNDSNVHSTANLLEMATEELHIKLMPLIMSAREEFYVATKDYSITQDQSDYDIPTRATGMVVRDIQIVEGNGVYSVPPIYPEDVSTTDSNTPEAYYLEHNKIILYPTPRSSTGTLRVRYYIRPGRLIKTSNASKITSINTSTNSVEVNTIPSSWSNGDDVDFISKTAPHANHAIDQTISSISGTTITFSSLPDDLATGDWIAQAGKSPLPQVPYEFYPVLAQMTVVKALEAAGDRDGGTRAYQDLETVKKNALELITPRNHGESKKIVSRNWRRVNSL